MVRQISKQSGRHCFWGGFLSLAGCLGAATLAPERFAFSVDGLDLVLPYQGSHPLVGSQGDVERVILAIHSLNYESQDAYNAVLLATGTHTGPTDSVAIFAPQFLVKSEVPTRTAEANLLYWNNFPFRGSSSARYGPGAESLTLSLFDVLDRMLEALTDPALFPHLKTVVIVGHSAGGQAVNRYAIAGRFESTLDPARRIHLRYVVLAPSSYLYFSPKRDPAGNGVFTVPDLSEVNACADYDEWGYGLTDLWTYPAATGEAVMRAQYPKRFVFYLVGANDNDPNHSTLSTSCQSVLQGAHRVARAQIYFKHLLDVFGPELRQFQALDLVPGVGHSYAGQLNSAAGRRYLLDEDSTDSDLDGRSDWTEWMSGTDPADPLDGFRIAWSVATQPLSYEMVWPSVPGRRYGILSNADLTSPFLEVDSVLAPHDGSEARWRPPASGDSRFYQVEVGLE